MKKTTRPMKAAIFDMDGTLIDSMGEWRKLNCSFVRGQGIELTEQQEKDLYSMSGSMVIGYIREHFGVEVDFNVLLQRAGRLMEPVYTAGVPLKPGAGAYLRRLRERGVKCVVATATPSRLAMIALNRISLVSDLDYIFSTDMTGGNKSDPAFYDRLCAMIGEKKEDCVMFEDALYAMRGAREAGLGVVGVTDDTNERDRRAIHEVCDVVIDSFDELE
ncbi:MAG: HAD family phosphatase [Clostridia bacterium]|nr:HAD family phosphatase [Clostridia bacterium]